MCRVLLFFCFFFSSRRRHTRYWRDWSSDVCSSDLVAKLMDYGKFKYESAQKAREARRNQALTVIKEMRLRLKIDPHDYETKKGHVERFLRSGDKVKITVMFRAREQSLPEMGYRLLQ